MLSSFHGVFVGAGLVPARAHVPQHVFVGAGLVPARVPVPRHVFVGAGLVPARPTVKKEPSVFFVLPKAGFCEIGLYMSHLFP